jgi:hypothetical protein
MPIPSRWEVLYTLMPARGIHPGGNVSRSRLARKTLGRDAYPVPP